MRMKFACCAPAKLRGTVKIWFNNIGYNITLEPELKPMRKSGGPPPPNQNNGKGPDGDDKDKEESMDDESINTEAWDKLGHKGKDGSASNGASAMAVDSVPPPAPSSHPQAMAKGGPGSARASPFDRYGSNLLSPLVPLVPVVPEADPKGIPASCEGSGLAVQFSPLSVSVGGGSPFEVLDKTLPLTPAPTTGKAFNLPPEDRADIGWASHASREFSKSNSGRQANKKTGRKQASRAVPVLEGTGAPETPRLLVMALTSPHPAPGTEAGERSTPPSGDPLRDKVAAVAPISKAATVGPRRSSVRPKGPKGDLSSLQRAQLLIAEKNLELTGNKVPRYPILDAFSDDHMLGVLDDCGVDSSCAGSSADLLSLIQSKELAQAALTEAAAAAGLEVGASVPSSMVPVEEGVVAGAAALSSPCRTSTVRRVAKS